MATGFLVWYSDGSSGTERKTGVQCVSIWDGDYRRVLSEADYYCFEDKWFCVNEVDIDEFRKNHPDAIEYQGELISDQVFEEILIRAKQ